jgi:hypothetical protein
MAEERKKKENKHEWIGLIATTTKGEYLKNK